MSVCTVCGSEYVMGGSSHESCYKFKEDSAAQAKKIAEMLEWWEKYKLILERMVKEDFHRQAEQKWGV